jgi:putative hydrolase of HD superfamily
MVRGPPVRPPAGRGPNSLEGRVASVNPSLTLPGARRMRALRRLPWRPMPTTPLLPALLALEPLHSLPRTGWILRGIQAPESVGDHVLSTAFVVLALSGRIEAKLDGHIEPTIDLGRALALALVHDVPEALTGDLPRSASKLLPAGAKVAMEGAAARTTREARFVRVCDRLQLGLRLVAYVRAGRKGLEEFRTTVAALDCHEFSAAADLKAEILAAL